MDRDSKAPWEGVEARHRDGAIGKILGPVAHMPGYFTVQFNDGVKCKQRADAMFINGEPLDKLMRDLDQDFRSPAPWKELCLSPIEFIRKRFEAWKLARYERTQSEIIELVSRAQYDQAETLYKTLPEEFWRRYAFLDLIARHKDKLRNERGLQEQIADALIGGRLWAADDAYHKLNESTPWPVEDYVALKRDAAAAILADIRVGLDEEQVHALLRPEHQLLIRARAGSGKTRTLAAKATLAIKDEGLEPDQVLILAFNKSAAIEIKRRVRTMGHIPAYENARTFHSLAHQLIKPKRKLLFDAGGHPSSQKQSLFIQSVIHKILTPAFKEALYNHFRKELDHLEEIGRDLPEDEYFLFRRSLEYVSLSGEKVKSNGEKYIADFLFEHGIRFEYEKVYDWKKKGVDGFPYAPDFSIVSNGRSFVLEHWAIDPNDASATLPEYWDTDTQTYRYQITNKRAFWQAEGITLLETHTGMTRQGRDLFEAQLHAILTSAGIHCEKLPKDELIQRVVDNDFVITHLAQMFLQFIQRSKKRGWSPDNVGEVLRSRPDPEPRSRMFHDLALLAYREYEQAMEAQGAMDFDDLLVQATEEVKAHGSSCTLHLGLGRDISIGELRWILVDEFQDFSELYYRMLNAILLANPEIKLVAVGDDWQAINAFAGAETRFFKDFAEYFNGSTVGITTNYRSARSIVGMGNAVMTGQGVAARSFSTESGQIQTRSLKDVWIEFRSGEEFADARKDDALYIGPLEDGKGPGKAAQRRARALKACAEFALETPTKGVLLLARTNNVYGVRLDEFREQLDRILDHLCKRWGFDHRGAVKSMTSHGSKGQESPIVIVLDATKKQFPKIHPDNLLFIPFGVTPETVIDEERRLFYVAVTRSEERLLILTEKDEESPFLLAASGYGGDWWHPDDEVTKIATKHLFSAKVSELVNAEGGYPPIPSQAHQLISNSNDWSAIRNDVDPQYFELIDLLAAENLPLPAIAYQLPDEDVEAALAWPDAPTPIAVLSREQERFANIWRSQGYRIPPLHLPPTEIVRGIRHYVAPS